MANFKVWSGATGAGTGADWANAFTTLAAAVTSATGNWDVAEVADDHLDVLGAHATYTTQNNLAIICVNRTTGALSEQNLTNYYIGSSSNYNISFAGPYALVLHGLALRNGGPSVAAFNFGNSSGSDGMVCIASRLKFGLYSTSTSLITVGYASAVQNCQVEFVDCWARFGNSGQGFRAYGTAKVRGLTVDPTGSAPAVLVMTANYAGDIEFDGCDLSPCKGLLASQSVKKFTARFTHCALSESVVPLGTQSLLNPASGEVILNDCTKGSARISGHYNALGSTEMVSSVYANDTYTFDGTNRASWKITTTAYASFYSPYVSPWLDQYHDGTAAITPYLDVARDGSATPLQDNQAWAEFAYLGTSGSSLASFASDRMPLLGTPANQAASSKGAGDWTGESATAWFGKFDSGSAITPAAKGSLRARVCVGAANETLYVEPQIRGVA